jgi:5-oxoprolinase (ATP-hydrolysing) subunit A
MFVRLSFDPSVIVVTLANTEAERAARSAGLRVARLFLADRAYDDQGLLVSRKLDGAVIKDLGMVTQRVIEVLAERTIMTISGRKIQAEVDSILVHSGTPGAVALGQAIRSAIKTANGRITPLSQIVRR